MGTNDDRFHRVVLTDKAINILTSFSFSFVSQQLGDEKLQMV